MGARGPQKTPTKILEQRGSWRAGTRKDEPAPSSKLPRCPSWLDDVAHKEWKRIVAELQKMELIGAADYAVIVGYCEAWSRYKDAVEKVQQAGVLVISKKDGEIRRSPMVFVLKDSREAMLKFARELGLSPAARASVTTIGKTGETSALEKLLSRRGSLN